VVGPRCSVTIGINTPEEIRKRVDEAGAQPILKVKLGRKNDREVIRLIRGLTDKTIWVDANEGWRAYAEAIDIIEFLAGTNVQFVEQPMPASQKKDLEKLKLNSLLALIADEGFTGHEPLAEIAERYDGINIKLMKIGGMARALKTIAQARMLNLRIMISCMVESSMADYADIDAPFLIDDDPFTGFKLNHEGRVTLNDSPGLGVGDRTALVRSGSDMGGGFPKSAGQFDLKSTPLAYYLDGT